MLHQLLANYPLDFFVLFSSASALLGQPGQGNYAAANAFLDTLAHYRRAQGRPALTINWGAWSDLGFANTSGGKRLAAHLARMGIESLPAQKALEVLQQLLEQNATQAVAVSINWHKFSQFFQAGAASPLLSGIAREASNPSRNGENGSYAAILCSRHDRNCVISCCNPIWSNRSRECSGSPRQSPEVHQPLSNLGLDSLMAIELKNRIVLDLGINLPIAKFMQGPSIDQATTLILEQLAAETSEPFAAAQSNRYANRAHATTATPRVANQTNNSWSAR